MDDAFVLIQTGLDCLRKSRLSNTTEKCRSPMVLRADADKIASQVAEDYE